MKNYNRCPKSYLVQPRCENNPKAISVSLCDSLISFIKKIRYKFRVWKINNRYHELDMDMQCTNMSYKQYLQEIDQLKIEHDEIIKNYNKTIYK